MSYFIYIKYCAFGYIVKYMGEAYSDFRVLKQKPQARDAGWINLALR